MKEVDLLSTAPLLIEQEKIVVLDYGSQYNQLITRTIREFGVYSELHAHTTTAEEIKNMNPVGIILSGGPVSVGMQMHMELMKKFSMRAFQSLESAMARA